MYENGKRDGEICENGTVKCAFPIMKHFLFPFFLFYFCVDMSSCCVYVYRSSRKAGNVDDDDDDVSFCKLMHAEEM